MEEDSKGTGLSNVIRIDDDRVREHLGHIVRGTVEETLNAMLEAEADRLCNAERYERTAARRDQRSGSYDRKLQTKAGAVTLKVPKLRVQTFETAIIERYRRRESSGEEALIEMYLAGVSVRRVEDITEALWGTRVSPGTVSNLNKKIYGQIEAWRTSRSTASSRMSISTASCSSARGRAKCATCRCWWRSRSMLTATARSLASSRAPRRTRPAGAPSWPISRGAGCAASSSSSRMPAWAWSRVPPSSSPRRAGSAVWCTSIATSSAMCRPASCARWR